MPVDDREPTIEHAVDGLRKIEACVLGQLGIVDCAVVRRRDLGGAARLVAYVVGDAAIDRDPIRARCVAADVEAPDVVVRVSTLPLQADGSLDMGALTSLAIVDSDVVDRVRALVISNASVEAAEVAAVWPDDPDRGFRSEELVPEWARTKAEASPRVNEVDASEVSEPSSRPSLSIGAPIVWESDPPRRLADLLARAAVRHPDNGVVCVDEDGEVFQSYPALRDRAERIMAGLRAAGLRPGDPVIFQFERNQDLIAAFWGCVLGGFVPTPIAVPTSADPTLAAAVKVKNAWEMLGRPRILTSAELEQRLAQLKNAFGLPDLQLDTVERLQRAESGEAWYAAAPGELALMLLTSGSTGLPKAVTQTQNALVSACAAMAQRNGFTERDVPINWISLDHVGGIVMCHLMYVALGSRQVHARTDYFLRDPLRWLDLIDRHGGTFTWAPNFAFALVNDRASEVAARRWNLASMRFVLNGGEAVVAQTARRFLRLLAPHGLPGTAMHPAWGMSETCSAATFSEPFLFEETRDDNALVEVGPPDPEFEIRIVDDRGELVPHGAEGRLEVRGPNVTRGYYNNAEANAEAFTSDGWFKTGDLGKLTDGRLTITGREKGIIIVNGVNYYAHEVEAAVEGVAGVTPSFTGAFAVREPGAETDALVVAFHTSANDDAELIDVVRRARAAILERVGIAPRYLLPVERADIPKTDIGKIQRPALTKRFHAGGFIDALRRVDQLTQRADRVPNWFFRPGWRTRSATAHRPVGPGTVVIAVDDDAGLAGEVVREARSRGAAGSTVKRSELREAVARAESGKRLIVVVNGRADGAEAGEADQAAEAERATLDLIDLLRTVSGARTAEGGTTVVVADHATQLVKPGDPLDIGRASAIAMARTAVAEYPALSIRHVDLAPWDVRIAANAVIAEAADVAAETEVAYRDGSRWVRRLTRGVPATSARGHAIGRGDGFYVITGGLGGLGVEVCRQLMRLGAKGVLLVGRTPIEALSDERRSALASLQASGDVRYVALDVADERAFESAVADAEEAWARPLTGVWHLAGAFEPRAIADETSETLATAMRAKVRGAWSVHRSLLRRPGAVLIAFSSVNGYLGGSAAGAYAVSNAFLDALAQYHVTALGRPAYSIGWSLWGDIGMSREYSLKSSAARRGYRSISLPAGMVSLLAAIAGEPGHQLIGLDGANPLIQRFVDGPLVTEELSARVVPTNGTAPQVIDAPTDLFGSPVPVRLRVVESLAAIRGGAGGARSGTLDASGGVAFGNELERRMADVFGSVLSAVTIGPNDNFFDLGVNSLLVATACHKLGETLGRTVPLTDLYRFPTLRLLAQHYGGSDTEAAALDDSEERGQARRARRLQRRRNT